MRKEPPDLILLDVNMPGIGGIKRAVRFGVARMRRSSC